MFSYKDFSYTPIFAHREGDRYVIDSSVTVRITYSTDVYCEKIAEVTVGPGVSVPAFSLPAWVRILVPEWDDGPVSALAIFQYVVYSKMGQMSVGMDICDMMISRVLESLYDSRIARMLVHFIMDFFAGWSLDWKYEDNPSSSLKVSINWL